MKLSKREIILLTLLIIIGLFYLEYQFVFAPGLDHFNELTTKQAELDAQIDEITLNLKMAEVFAKKRDESLKQIETLSAPFIDGLKSDSLLLFTHDLMQRNGFLPSAYTLSMIEGASLVPNQLDINELTYQLGQLAEQYKNTETNAPKETEPADNQPSTTPSEENQDSDAVEQLTIQINAETSYAQILQLLDDLKGLNRSIIVSDLKINSTSAESLNVDISLFFIGIKSLEPRNDDLTQWSRAPYDGGSANPYQYSSPQETTKTTP